MKTTGKLARKLFPSLICCLVVLIGQTQLFAFNVGDKVQANGLVYVRQTAGGTYLGTQPSGTQGTVLGGPTYLQIGGTGTYYYWYNIDWPSAPDGWVADVGLIAAPVSSGTISLTVNASSGGTLAASDINVASLLNSGGQYTRITSPSSYPINFTSVPYGTYYFRIYCWDMLGVSGGNFSHNAAMTYYTATLTNAKKPLNVTVYYNNGTTKLSGATVYLDSWNGESSTWTLARTSAATDSSGLAPLSAYQTTQSGEYYRLRIIYSGTQVGVSNTVYVLSSGSSYSITTTVAPPVTTGTISLTVNAAGGGALAPSEMNVASLLNSGGQITRFTSPSITNPMSFPNITYGTYYFQIFCWDMLAVASGTFSHNAATTYYTATLTNSKKPLNVTVYYNNGTTKLSGATVYLDSWNGESSTWTLARTSAATDSSGLAPLSAYQTTQSGEYYRLRVIYSGTQVGVSNTVYVLSSGSSYSIITTVAPPTQSGNISVRLKDSNGVDAPVGSGTPRFALYTNTISVQNLSGANPATFSNIPVGSSYLLEGYQTGSFWGEEFWGSQRFSVAAGATTSAVITQQYPYVIGAGVVMKNVETGATILPGQTIPAGIKVRFEVTVRNDVPNTPLNASVHFVADFGKNAPYDYDWPTNNVQNIFGNGGQAVFSFTTAFDAHQTGQIYFALEVFTVVNGRPVLTDSWDWTQACQTARTNRLAGTVYRTDNTTPYPADIVNLTGQNIDPDKQTWLIIHGRGSSRNDSIIAALAQAVATNRQQDQVLTLDWSAAAAVWGVDFGGAYAITNVAAWATSALEAYGFSGSKLNLVGHSWGACVSAEIAQRTSQSINTIVALDPAARFLAGSSQPEDTTVDFSKCAFSWAFHSSLDGSAHTPTNATEAFVVQTGLNLVLADAHNAVVNMFAYMLTHPTGGVSSQFQLDRLLSHQRGLWVQNSYATSFQQGADYEATTPGYEGVIYNNYITSDGLSPYELVYTNSSLHQAVVLESADTITPTISAFTVTPTTSITLGSSYTATYTVSDTGGSGLKQVVLRRTSGNGSATDSGWHDIQTNTITGNGPVSGSFTPDTPPSAGTYYYGMAVYDNASPVNNSTTEGAAGFLPGPRTVIMPPVQNGSLQVTLSPAGAISAGAFWQVDGGGWQNSGATVSGLGVGSHTVAFQAVTGYTTPANQIVSIANGATTPATGTYTPVTTSGSLQVTLSPAGAISAGALWQVDGGAWQSSGATVPSLGVGSHTVAFQAVSGYTTPANQIVSIANGATTPATGTYTPVTTSGSLQVTLSPSGAISAGALWQVDGGAWQSSGATVPSLGVGSHTVAFQAVTGYTTPANQIVTIANGVTTPATGTYTPVTTSGSLQVTLSPSAAISAGALWQVDGGAWQITGATVPSLSVGSHTVAFQAVTGYATPANQIVTIANGATTPATGTYTQAGGGDITTGLVAYYPFDGNADDVSGNGNNGTVNGATLTTNRFGESNRAYYFDGQSKIVANDQALPFGNASRTISLWVNCQPGAMNRLYAIPFKYGNNSPSQGNWINIFTGNDGSGRPPKSVLFDFYNSALLSTSLIGLNTWQHLVCTLEGSSTAKMYINGQLAGIGSVTANTTPSGVMSIGGYDGQDAATTAFIGVIDDVRIYNRALSSNDVAQLYASEAPAVINVQGNPSNGGTVTGSGNYVGGTNVQIIASANSGWIFTGWNDSNTQTSRTVTVPAGGTNYIANFQPAATISVVPNPSIGGSAVGGGTYVVGTNVQISASANNGYTFTGWSDGNSSASRTITVPASNITYAANFTVVPTSTKIILVSGNLSFGNVTNGTTATARLTISNTGNTNLIVSSIGYPTGFSGAWNGSIPAGGSTNVVVTFAPVVVTTYTGTVTVLSDATNSGGNTTAVSGTSIVIPVVATPVITPTGGTFTNSVQVTLTCATPSATIRYTIDGNDPTASSTLYTNAITLTNSVTLKTKASKASMTDSGIAAVAFTIKQVYIANLTNGLVAYYPFNGNANDASGNGHTGTLQGSPSLISDRLGTTNRAYSFNGTSDSVRITNAVTLATTNLTLSAWIRIAHYGADANFGGIILSDYGWGGNPVQYCGYVFFVDQSGHSGFRLSTPGTGSPPQATGSTVIPLSQWTHIAATYDGNLIRVYVNGGQDGVYSNFTTYCATEFVDTFIGAASWFTGDFFSGAIDDVRIYNRALSTNDIAQLYASETPVTINVQPNPSNGGTVTGSGTYVVGTNVQIIASANIGWIFTRWSDSNTQTSRTVAVPAGGTNYIANFQPSATISVVPNPSTGGSAVGGGTYVVGTNVQISASANSGYTFARWSDGNTQSPRTIIVPTTNITYTANFQPAATIAVVPNPASGGSVVGSGTYVVGTNVQISVSANSGYTFTSWSDGNTQSSRTVMVPATNITYTANFTVSGGGGGGSGSGGGGGSGSGGGGGGTPPITMVTINVVANPITGGTVIGTGSYAVGASQLISATANTGWTFAGWSDGNTQSSRSITVPTGDATYTANFTPTPTKIIGLSGSLAFGNVTTGTTAMTTLTISNTGTAPLTINSITYPNGFNGAWNGAIAAGGSHNVTVSFAPTTLATYSGTVTVSSDATTGTSLTTASGTGIATINSSDLEIVEVYLADQQGLAANRVDNPQIGQQVYPHISYKTHGSQTMSGTIWRLIIDGATLYSYSGSASGEQSSTGWCTSPWTVTAGSHTLTGMVNPDGAIAESNYANNIANLNFTVSGPPCTYSISSASANVGTLSGSGSFTVTTGNNCSRQASSDAPSWLHPSSGQTGSGTVSYNYDANPDTIARTGHITVGDQTFTLTQAGSNTPSHVLITMQANPPNAATVSWSRTFTVGSSQTISTTARNGWVFVGWDDGTTDNPRTIIVPASDTTYTAYFQSVLDYVKVTTETYQDKLVCDSGNNCGTYPTGSFTVNAVLFTGAGIAAASLNGDTPVTINIGNWYYYGASGTLGDDPKYKAKATRATLPLIYQDSNGNLKSAGTATLGFGRNNVILSITSKAGQDAQGDIIQSFIDADTLTGQADPGHSIAVGDKITATITIGDYSESFTNIVITGTDAVKNSKAKDGTMYQLDTVKIKGVSH